MLLAPRRRSSWSNPITSRFLYERIFSRVGLMSLCLPIASSTHAISHRTSVDVMVVSPCSMRMRICLAVSPNWGWFVAL